MLAINMIQRETQNDDQSIEDDVDTIDNSGELCMFKIYTPTKDG